jgi:hypothetical protein
MNKFCQVKVNKREERKNGKWKLENYNNNPKWVSKMMSLFWFYKNEIKL